MANSTPDINELTARIEKQAAGKKGFGKAILLDMGEDGAIRIDGTSDEVAINNDASPADATISMTVETLSKLMAGKLSAPYAAMSGKVKVKGEAMLALELAKFL